MAQRDIYSLPPAAKPHNPSWVRTGYGFGAALILLGAVVAGIAGGSVLSAIRRGSHTVHFPGAANLKLKAGLHIGLPGSPDQTAAGLFVTVTDGTTGESVPVLMGDSMTVAVNGARGARPLFQFDTLDEGTYLVSGTASAQAGSVPVYILHESLSQTRSDLVVGVLAGTLLVGTGGALLWFVHRKRKLLPVSA